MNNTDMNANVIPHTAKRQPRGVSVCGAMPKAPRRLCDARGEGEFGYVELEVYECSCGFHIGVDYTYLDQVGDLSVSCPVCGVNIEVTG